MGFQLIGTKLFPRVRSEKVAPAGQQEPCLCGDAKFRFQVSGFGCQENESLNPET
jgi:hypothetical protein